jgi:hypothetical protein
MLVPWTPFLRKSLSAALAISFRLSIVFARKLSSLDVRTKQFCSGCPLLSFVQPDIIGHGGYAIPSVMFVSDI